MDFVKILATVAAIWTIAAVTPGPNFFITAQTALGAGRRLSIYTVAGIVTGTFIWALSGFLGIAIIFKVMPKLYYTLKFIGGAYLIYIGITFLREKNTADKKAIKKPLFNPIHFFKQGLFTNLLNPKTAAFMTSLFAATIPPNASFELGLLCVALICSISGVWYATVAALLSRNEIKRAYRKHKPAIEKLAGAVFIFFGIKLATSE